MNLKSAVFLLNTPQVIRQISPYTACAGTSDVLAKMSTVSAWAVPAGCFHAVARLVIGLGIVLFLVLVAPPRYRRDDKSTQVHLPTAHPGNYLHADLHSNWQAVWVKHREKLCPNGSPAVATHQAALFTAARRLANLQPSNISSEEELGLIRVFVRSKLGRWFFRLSQGGWAFSDSSIAADEEHVNIAYIRQFKCATGQLHAYGVEQLARTGGRIRHYAAGQHFRRVLSSATCVLMVVRDPVEHFLSGYNEVETRMVNGSGYAHSGEMLPLPFAQRLVGSPERFADFFIDLLTIGVDHHHDPPDWFTHDLLPHVLPLTGALHEVREAQRLRRTTTSRGKLVVVPLSEVELEVPRQLRQKCAVPRAPPMQQAGQRPSSRDPTGAYAAARKVWNKGGDIAKALCALHAFDYACFAHLLPPPPACHEVFGDPTLLQLRQHLDTPKT